MSKLEELIKIILPFDLKTKLLGDLEDEGILTLGRGEVISKKDMQANPGDYPVYSSSASGDGQIGSYGKYMFDDERITWSIDGGGKLFYRNNIKYSITNVGGWLKVDRPDILITKYLYYCLINQWMRKSFDYTHKAHPSIIRNEYSVPLPALAVQLEIVRILDTFTELTAELTAELIAELTARKKQYEWYRDELLTFGDEVPTVALSSVATVTKLAGFEFTKYVNYSNEGSIIALRGLNVKNGKLDLHDVKYVDLSDFSKLNRSKLYVGDMLFTYVGTIGQVALVDEADKYYLAPNVALIRANTSRLIPEFMRYYFQSKQFWKNQVMRLLQSSSMQNIPMEKIRKFELPIPSLEEQRRIINLLNRFDTLCNDITTGLPAEIEARKKQYEFYRDKLLTFPEAKA